MSSPCGPTTVATLSVTSHPAFIYSLRVDLLGQMSPTNASLQKICTDESLSNRTLFFILDNEDAVQMEICALLNHNVFLALVVLDVIACVACVDVDATLLSSGIVPVMVDGGCKA